MSRTLRLAALACVASMALPASRAHAQPQDQQPPAPAGQPLMTAPELPVTPPAPAPIVTTPPMTTVEVERYWYVLMLADLSWLWASIRLDEENLAFVAYPAMAPAVHVLMDKGRGALQSLALRIGVGALTYLYLTVRDTDDDALLRTGGVFLGAAAAFDWFYLGKTLETVPLPARRGRSSTWTWAPSVVAGEDGLQVGISGAF
jgi:hypothetical protein